jgi:Sulfotransferase family
MTLPNFLIIGAAKAGTTSLYEWFRPHPAIFMPALKEPRFFSYDPARSEPAPVRTLEEYAALFEGVTTETAIGEASPHYLMHGAVPERIAATLPGVRLIAALRDPAERAFSVYQMNLRNRGVNDGVPFLQAIETDGNLRGGYATGLARYFARFPRERIRIVLFEEIAGAPLATAQALFGFLGVDEGFVPDVARISNPGGLPRVRALHGLLNDGRLRYFARSFLPESVVARGRDLRARNLRKQAMRPEERRAAVALFREDVLRTQDLIGRDLAPWLAA